MEVKLYSLTIYVCPWKTKHSVKYYQLCLDTCAPDIYGPYWTLSAVSHRVYCGWVRVLGMHDVHKFGRKFSCRQPKYTWNNTKHTQFIHWYCHIVPHELESA